MAYVYLAGAIFFEVAGTMLLPVSQNFTRLLPSVALVAAYGVSFYFLTFAIRDIPIAIVYASRLQGGRWRSEENLAAVMSER